jgi:hypothetical protein
MVNINLYFFMLGRDKIMGKGFENYWKYFWLVLSSYQENGDVSTYIFMMMNYNNNKFV